MSTLLSVLPLNACTLIYVEGSSETITDSGTYRGSLTVPEPSATHTGSLSKIRAP